MAASIRLLSLAGGLALLAACDGQPAGTDNLAELDARLTNGVIDAGEAGVNDTAALAAAGGRIEKAPPAVRVPAGSEANTLGALARRQASRRGAAPPDAGEGACAQSVRAGPEWAERIPAPFRVYPGATLDEAAGIDRERCQIAIISFTTGTGIDRIMDFYYTQARRAGYDAEHLLSGDEHQLGGTRGADGAAYVVFARPAANGRTEVDVIASPD